MISPSGVRTIRSSSRLSRALRQPMQVRWGTWRRRAMSGFVLLVLLAGGFHHSGRAGVFSSFSGSLSAFGRARGFRRLRGLTRLGGFARRGRLAVFTTRRALPQPLQFHGRFLVDGHDAAQRPAAGLFGLLAVTQADLGRALDVDAPARELGGQAGVLALAADG